MTAAATSTPTRTRPRPPANGAARPARRSATRTATRTTTPRAAAHPSARGAPAAATAAATAPRRAPAPRSAPRPRPQLRVVESPADRRRRVLRNRRVAVAGTLLAVIGVFTIVACHVMLAQGQVGLTKLQQQVSTAEREYQQARYAHAQAASPTRIVEQATKQGLVPADRAPVPVGVPEATTSNPGSSDRTLDGYTSVKGALGNGP